MTTAPEIPFTTQPDLDLAIHELTAGAAAWAAMGLRQRIRLLESTRTTIGTAAADWAERAIEAKGTPRGPLEGEEWMSGPSATLAGFAAVIESLYKLNAGKSPVEGVPTRAVPGDRTAFQVLPGNRYESALFSGFKAEVWLRPGVSAAQASKKAGLEAKHVRHNGGVGLVLGAGNISSIGPLDVLYELVAYNRVSILKLNPTFRTLLPAYEKAFAPMIEAGLLRVVNGGAEEGQYLTGHPGIDHVHITGSGITHDLIVWGSTTDKSGTPNLTKPITSELGGVSPIIVVPGKWSAADLRFQAEHVATQRLHNAGHNCIAGQALILSDDWAQKDQFLTELRRVLAEMPARPAWYPGSEKKLGAARNSYPAAENLNGRTLVQVDATTAQDLYTTEYFAPVLGYTALPGDGINFLRSAVTFANKRLDGNLGASVIVAPKDRKKMGAGFEEAIADLHYGTVGINVWSGVGFLMPNLSWGAFPGSTLEDVGSGIGIVHNAHLLDDVERSVVHGPFRPFPRSILHGENSLTTKPAWFVTAKSGKEVGRRLTDFNAKPSWLKLPGIFNQAIRG